MALFFKYLEMAIQVAAMVLQFLKAMEFSLKKEPQTT